MRCRAAELNEFWFVAVAYEAACKVKCDMSCSEQPHLAVCSSCACPSYGFHCVADMHTCLLLLLPGAAEPAVPGP
jgi:hypothetical protein